MVLVPLYSKPRQQHNIQRHMIRMYVHNALFVIRPLKQETIFFDANWKIALVEKYIHETFCEKNANTTYQINHH